MDAEPGVTLFEPVELKLNIDNHQEDDEEAVEDQKRRAEVLQAQLANAFDDWSDDDDRVHSSGSSHGDNSKEGGGSHLSNGGMIFHNLSDISEHSPNKSGYHSAEVSKDSDSGNSTKLNGKRFSPSRSVPYKFVQMNGTTTDYLSGIGGRGDADQSYQPIFKSPQNIEKKEKFQPIFSNNTTSDKSDHSNNDSAEAYRQAEFNSLEQLQVLYEVRLHEIKRLTVQLEEERQVAASHKQDMFRKLALMEAEKERAVLSRTEANKLLVTSKEEIGKLQKEVHLLKQTVASLEKDKVKSDELAELSKIEIQDLEQRIALMERCDPNKNFVKQMDITVKDLKTKHQQEVHQLQRQIDTLNKKLLKKEEDCTSLKKKVTELERNHEVLLVDKSDTINQLAQTLEKSQLQCQQLMTSNVSVDNVRLQTLLADALHERDELSQTVKNLQVQCSMMQSDLAQYESVTKFTLPNSNSSSDTDSIVQLGLGVNKEKHSLTNINVSDNTAKLKDELHRALLSQKVKRAEIQRLDEVVQKKESQIQEMTKQERIYLAGIETLNEKLQKVMEEMRIIKEERENKDEENNKTEVVDTLHAKIAELQKEKAVIEKEKLETQQRLDDLTKCFEMEKRRERSDYNKEYLKFHDETVAKLKKELEEEADMKVKVYRVQLDQSLKEVAEVKDQYVSVCQAKEEVVQSLNQATERLQQVTAERDRLAAELETTSALRDKLARRLNETSMDERMAQQRDRLKAELDKCEEIKDQLAERVNTFKRENNELNAELHKLKAELAKKSQQRNDSQLSAECTRLRGELSAMSTRHTQELSVVRTELQAARDRVIQLEKCTRLQFETELKSLRQERDMLKTKCDDKEVQIKKLIESRKRPPTTVSIATETDLGVSETNVDVLRLEERHQRELARCREEYQNVLATMEEAHQEALIATRDKNKELIDSLQEKYQKILEEMRRREVNYRQSLLDVEERTKQVTVSYFAEEFKKLEARFIEEAKLKTESLQKALQEKANEVGILKHQLETLREECKVKVATLQNQIETDRDNASELMMQWTQEIKNIQGELKLKEAIIDDQRSKIEKAESSAKKYRSKLLKTNKEVTAQYMSKCAEYKGKMQALIEESEKAVFEKIKQLENVYEEREKELKKQISRKQNIT